MKKIQFLKIIYKRNKVNATEHFEFLLAIPCLFCTQKNAIQRNFHFLNSEHQNQFYQNNSNVHLVYQDCT